MDAEAERYFGKMPRGGQPQPVPRLTAPTHPGDFGGGQPSPGRRNVLPPPSPDLFAPSNSRTLPPSVIAGVTRENWYSPLQPVVPFGPPDQTMPREWDYPVGINLDIQPRRQFVFNVLRQAAEQWGILATTIEARIDEMLLMPWSFTLKNEQSKVKNDKDPRIKMLTQFFEKPDRKRSYEVWMRMIFRERYVIDAASAFIRRSADGVTPYAIEVLDGATIKPLVDDAGRRPDWPSPAYQQIIKGLPFDNFTEREIIYSPARPRTNMPIYGYSEVEQIFSEAMQGISKTLYQGNFWQEGTMPDLMLGVPENWTPEQIAMWQASFDALLSGNLREKSRARFIPGGMKPFEIKGSAGELLKCDYDEWLARIICRAFRMPPTPYIKELNRSTSENASKTSTSEGLYVEMTWWKSFMNDLVSFGWGFDDIEYTWEPKPEVDPVQQATMLTTYIKAATMTVNESRNKLGLDPIEGGDEAMVYTATGAIPLKDLADGAILDLQQQAQDTQQQGADATMITAKKPASKPAPAKGGTTKVDHPFPLGRRSKYYRDM